MRKFLISAGIIIAVLVLAYTAQASGSRIAQFLAYGLASVLVMSSGKFFKSTHTEIEDDEREEMAEQIQSVKDALNREAAGDTEAAAK